MNELTITAMSAQRVLSHLCATHNRRARRIHGKAIFDYCQIAPANCFFEDRSFFGKGETFSYLDLKARGVKSILVRCNADRDLVTVKVQ